MRHLLLCFFCTVFSVKASAVVILATEASAFYENTSQVYQTDYSQLEGLVGSTVTTYDSYSITRSQLTYPNIGFSLNGIRHITEECVSQQRQGGCWSYASRDYFDETLSEQNVGTNYISQDTLDFGFGNYVMGMGFEVGHQIDQLFSFTVSEVNGATTIFEVNATDLGYRSYYGFSSDIGITSLIVDSPLDNGGRSNWYYTLTERSDIVGGLQFEDQLFSAETFRISAPNSIPLILLGFVILLLSTQTRTVLSYISG